MPPKAVKAAKAAPRKVAKPKAKAPAVDPVDPEVKARQDRLAEYGVNDRLTKVRRGTTNDSPFTAKGQREWLERSKDWKSMKPDAMNGATYVPVKVLGGGSNGTVGLWEVVEDGNDGVGITKHPPENIVIKQSIGGGVKLADQEGRDACLAMQWESKLLRQIMGTGTEHVVKIYRGYHLDEGSGTDAIRDPVPLTDDKTYNEENFVARIYLEYCANGSLESYIKWSDDAFGIIPEGRKKKVFRIGRYPEENAWRIMMCIFKGLLVLERGDEDYSEWPVKQAWDNAIAHFDIKPDNVVIGELQDKHTRLNIMKLTDFGCAFNVPSDAEERKEEKWLAEAWWRKTKEYAPPEQHFVRRRKNITTKTGVWSAAASIYRMLCGVEILQKNAFIHPRSEKLTSGDSKILLNPDRFSYSDRLVELLCDCLAVNPDDRPEIPVIVRRIHRVLKAYDSIERDIGDDPLHDAEQLNEIWREGKTGVFEEAQEVTLEQEIDPVFPAYNRDNEQIAVDNDDGAPFYFMGLRRVVGAPVDTLANYIYQALYKVPVFRSASAIAADDDAQKAAEAQRAADAQKAVDAEAARPGGRGLRKRKIPPT